MSCEVHVRFCEGVGVKFPRATHRNIYVRTRQAGERLMASFKRYLEKKLRLKVNEAKSRVDRPWNCKFLGYSMTEDLNPLLRGWANN